MKPAIVYMQLEGIISIQAGENPRIVRDKTQRLPGPSDVKAVKEPGKATGANKKAPAGNARKQMRNHVITFC